VKLCLKALRREHGLTQSAIAEALSCDQSLYSKYERGERALPLDFAVNLADYYGITLDALVGRSSVPPAAITKRY
jgi:transcriptional regulator with XRE-family HTH domain